MANVHLILFLLVRVIWTLIRLS